MGLEAEVRRAGAYQRLGNGVSSGALPLSNECVWHFSAVPHRQMNVSCWEESSRNTDTVAVRA